MKASKRLGVIFLSQLENKNKNELWLRRSHNYKVNEDIERFYCNIVVWTVPLQVVLKTKMYMKYSCIYIYINSARRKNRR